jgi:hypothetical protein
MHRILDYIMAQLESPSEGKIRIGTPEYDRNPAS